MLRCRYVTTLVLIATLTLVAAKLSKDCKALVACPANYDPVCGSNGKTYSNACNLLLATCAAQEDAIEVAYAGECGSQKHESLDKKNALC